jgi:predicted  nucleic acid-binding Zn-ribbon protein
VNTANIITATIPTFAVLLGILFNRQEITSLRADMRAESASVRGEIASVRGEITQLRSEMIQLRDSVHHDMVGLHERIAVVESKQGS